MILKTKQSIAAVDGGWGRCWQENNFPFVYLFYFIFFLYGHRRLHDFLRDCLSPSTLGGGLAWNRRSRQDVWYLIRHWWTRPRDPAPLLPQQTNYIHLKKGVCVCNKKPKIIEDYKKSIKIRSRKEKRSKTKMSFSFETKCFAAAAASEKGRCVSRVDINLLHRKTFLFAWWFSFTYLLLSTTFKSPAPFSFCFLLLLLPRGV